MTLATRINERVRDYLWRLACLGQHDRIATFTLPDGSRFDYPFHSAIGGLMFIKGFEKAELEFVRSALQPGDVFLDIGANGGIYTLVAARRVGPCGHVFAFEPGQRELALLRRNVQLNQLDNVTIIDEALSDRTGTARFAVSLDGAMNSLAQNKHPWQKIQSWENVSTITLDEAMLKYRIPKVDFIKLDVEGAERLILAGAKKLMSSTEPLTMLFEAADSAAAGFGYTAPELLREVMGTGMALHYFAENGEFCRVEGMNALLPEFGSSIYNFVAVRPPR